MICTQIHKERMWCYVAFISQGGKVCTWQFHKNILCLSLMSFWYENSFFDTRSNITFRLMQAKLYHSFHLNIIKSLITDCYFVCVFVVFHSLWISAFETRFRFWMEEEVQGLHRGWVKLYLSCYPWGFMLI